MTASRRSRCRADEVVPAAADADDHPLRRRTTAAVLWRAVKILPARRSTGTVTTDPIAGASISSRPSESAYRHSSSAGAGAADHRDVFARTSGSSRLLQPMPTTFRPLISQASVRRDVDVDGLAVARARRDLENV